MQRKNNRAHGISAVLSATLMGVVLAACDQPAEQTNAPAPPPPSVTVTKAVEKPITESATFIGRIEAIEEVDLRARVEGFLLERAFVEGTDVEEGQLLFRIDPAEFQAKVELAKANVASAQASVTETEKTVARNEELLKRGNVSQATYDEAIARRDSAKADILARQAELKQAQLDLDYTTILSPLNGRIGTAAYSVGNLVGPSSDVLAEVTQLDPIYATFSISEKDYVTIQKARAKEGGDPNRPTGKFTPRLRLPDGAEYDHDGTWNYLGDSVDPGTGTVTVRAEFPNPDRFLIPGQFVSVIIQTSTPVTRLVVPQAAVQEDQQGPFVLAVGDDDTVSQVPIVTGGKDGFDWVVQSGLTPGTSVVVEGLQKVRPGVKVSPVMQEPDAAATDPSAGESGGAESGSDTKSSGG